MRDLYVGVGGPLYAIHSNGLVYAIFSNASQALAYWRGLDARGREYFHIENEDGERVVVKDQPHHPGHAYSILETLDRAERGVAARNHEQNTQDDKETHG